MITVQTIPFVHKPPLELLGLTDAARALPDPDFWGFGWCRPQRVSLRAPGSLQVVESPLLLAVHSTDHPEPGTPMLLEFWFDHDGEEVAVQVSWRRFAHERVVPLLLGTEADVVLALCNPHRLDLAAEACTDDVVGWAGRRLHFAHGDVTSWLEPQLGGEPTLLLQADAWRVSHGQ